MTGPQLHLTARLNPSAIDARRGLVRVHPEVLAALGVREWDAITLIGARRTAAVAAAAHGQPAGTALLDDVTLSNAGVTESGQVVVESAAVQGARSVVVRGSALATRSIPPETLRRALLGKVLTVGDTVSLLPRDLGPGTSTADASSALSRSYGTAWTSELLTVSATEPAGAVSVQPSTSVTWPSDIPGAATDAGIRSAVTTTGATTVGATTVGATAGAAATMPTTTAATPQTSGQPAEPRIPVDDLVGAKAAATTLDDWLALALDQPELLASLKASPRLGVLITGPVGVGKATVARSVIGERTLFELDGPTVGSLEAGSRLERVTRAVDAVVPAGGVLLITDVDALLPSTPEPVSALILDQLRRAIAQPGVAVIGTTAQPESLDARARDPQLFDRVLSLSLPDASVRRELLTVLLRSVPAGDLDLSEVAARTPGFVAADLAALLREASLRAAGRAREDGGEPSLAQTDLIGALSVIRPLSRSGTEELSTGSLSLDDVGNMVDTKQALTEAVLWPLRHPDSFARLGIDPPRGVLLFGPPGCGKTFIVRALAGSGLLNVHAVKGAELMDKWVGSSEKAVRDLFQRARDSAPSLIFLDEVDALAPRRGQSSDSGVGDRVVAALLTELDGVEPMRNVVVLGATNRPELIDPALLRPGRLERPVYVPPPDAESRAAILRAAGGSVPLTDEVDLDALAERLEGYSAADCSAVLREAALAAMRRDIDAAAVTAWDVQKALDKVRPSLDPAQVAALEAYADGR
ncbi:AAA family ATPase [Millisia brevis]|uniref:AAA family ATPase n=1 Tax=Millisia brevis TaxID=264148 RepID=UPI000835B155|nr:AAA family ATPase [Millisia brevis]